MPARLGRDPESMLSRFRVKPGMTSGGVFRIHGSTFKLTLLKFDSKIKKMNEVLSVQNLGKYYGKTKAVDGINFAVEKGEVFGFLGPNGAGKTTTIRCMMDFIRPSFGKISALGLESHLDSVQIKAKTGYLSGDVRIYENWTGHEHFKFIESIRGKSKILTKLIKDFDFDPKVKAKKLSSGGKQKLGIIMAFLNEPELLILDEPTTALDPLLQNTVYDYILNFAHNGTTVFMSSHNLHEVQKICSRVGIIKQGEIIAEESIEELRGKKIYVVEATFDGKMKRSDFELDGTEVSKESPESLTLRIKGDINPVISKLHNYKLKDLEVSHATLEDIFMTYYER
ncbi:multidrug ABC transporter ATP-binding protein [bacterium (Candidatus Howlettbacteria) CG23_combo_of_CG06-09_8_20_14_all_37_9]|nr:MAG: multidrug ABC transporter ATP-binding protein [bacterium (Candidatus Howlettbacteria) CG23_combo_of_CG06-09_8_20_14_all_37_9]